MEVKENKIDVEGKWNSQEEVEWTEGTYSFCTNCTKKREHAKVLHSGTKYSTLHCFLRQPNAIVCIQAARWTCVGLCVCVWIKYVRLQIDLAVRDLNTK